MYEFHIFICRKVKCSKIIGLSLGHAAVSGSPASLPFKIFFNNMIKEIFLVGPMPVQHSVQMMLTEMLSQYFVFSLFFNDSPQAFFISCSANILTKLQ